MNTISRKLMHVLLSALTIIVAAGCASKADKMPAPADTSAMPAASATSAMPAPADTSTMAAASATSAMPGTTDSKMPGTPDSSTLPATPDSTKMPGTPDGTKMPATPDSGAMPATPAIKLDGSTEVPPVKTKATADGTITVSADKSVSGSIKTTGIKATAAHIHEAAAGANGPVVIPLTKSPDNTWAVPAGAVLTDKQYASYMAGNLYVNVHSAAHKNGEIRAQLNPK
jgi:hypothetical protein